jgi:hypothetical protein
VRDFGRVCGGALIQASRSGRSEFGSTEPRLENPDPETSTARERRGTALESAGEAGEDFVLRVSSAEKIGDQVQQFVGVEHVN